MLNIEAINERFVGLSKAILKRRNLFLVLMVLVLAFSVYGLKQLKTDTDDSHYFDEGDALLLQVDADGGHKRIFYDRYYRFAIPLSERSNNSLCTNNDGWI